MNDTTLSIKKILKVSFSSAKNGSSNKKGAKINDFRPLLPLISFRTIEI